MQQPQKEMASRFWNVVVANKISHILFLNKLKVSRYSVKYNLKFHFYTDKSKINQLVGTLGETIPVAQKVQHFVKSSYGEIFGRGENRLRYKN
jgi:hypothetical protein